MILHNYYTAPLQHGKSPAESLEHRSLPFHKANLFNKKSIMEHRKMTHSAQSQTKNLIMTNVIKSKSVPLLKKDGQFG